jgi:hypothetical protein
MAFYAVAGFGASFSVIALWRLRKLRVLPDTLIKEMAIDE